MSSISNYLYIREKSSRNTLSGKEEFAFCGVLKQNVPPYRGSTLAILFYYFKIKLVS